MVLILKSLYYVWSSQEVLITQEHMIAVKSLSILQHIFHFSTVRFVYLADFNVHDD